MYKGIPVKKQMGEKNTLHGQNFKQHFKIPQFVSHSCMTFPQNGALFGHSTQ